MPTIRQFEKLSVWQTARTLVNLVYEYTRSGEFSKDFALRDQIRRAAISVMSNIAEGFDAGYDGEFMRFLGYSFRSAAEVQSQLYAARDQGYLSAVEFQSVYDKAVEVRKQIRALVSYLAKSRRVGRQIREEATEYGPDLSGDLVNAELNLPSELMAND
jgi:four helix bundle protein